MTSGISGQCPQTRQKDTQVLVVIVGLGAINRLSIDFRTKSQQFPNPNYSDEAMGYIHVATLLMSL